ncbi:MAG: glycosyltransferase family 4 protein [Proteiniphilum sp.]|nr:glycosyltransferase family 4 protein [Proteiniphilum sp.]MDD4799967.1 glycosyltransferase family 4 protein [Proteiniphilum sp.]
MKLLFLFGGIPPYMHALLNKLAQKGAAVTAVIPAGRDSILGKGVKVTDGSGACYRIVESHTKKSGIGKEVFPQLPTVIAQEQPDILIAGWPWFLQYFTQQQLRTTLRRQSVQFVIREIPFQMPPYGKARSYFRLHPAYDEEMKTVSRGTLFYLRQWIMMRIRRYCYAHADGALAYASSGKELMPGYGIAHEKVFVTGNSGDTEALLREKELLRDESPVLPKNDRRIIHIGRLVKWKRVDLLLDAFAQVSSRYPDAELVVVGDGPERERLRLQAEKLKVAEKVRFTGALHEPREVGALLLVSSLYVLAGMGGLSINDAMAYGLPVICSVCDGTERDLVTHGVNGFFFRENDADDLAEKIATLLDDPDRRKRMGEASREVIAHRINLETVADRYMDAFTRILA